MRKLFSTSKDLFLIDQTQTKQNKNPVFDEILNYLKRYRRKKNYYYK